jgi:membrane peptidoglycan carboxypeptidase
MQARSTLAHVFTIIMASLLAGVVLALAAIPAGAVAGSVMGWFVDLPSDLKIPPSAQASRVYANDGTTLITTFYDEYRRDVRLSDVAPVMRQAMVAAEDARFYHHGAVDPRSVLRAFVIDVRGGHAAEGASTLTMQYVRNVLKSDPNLTPAQRAAATADTVGRKLQEVRYAVALEKRFSKQEILNRYLNIAYFGDGAYGIAAASQIYFGKSPGQLTLPEAALLAGAVRSPDTDNPVTGDRAAALGRRGYVLEAMVGMHVITAAQARRAKAAPIELHTRVPANGCTGTAARQGWGFFCDYLRTWWDAQPAFGATPRARDDALRRGGYRIVTSLDPAIQAAAQAQALTVYGYRNRKALPMAVVEPGTGRILAMAVNRHYSLAANPGGHNGRPNTVDQLVAGGGGITGYQAGSTFKLFTMLAALTAGMPLDTSFDAPSRLITRYPASGPGTCGGFYCPANANPGWMDGRRTMWDGFGRSVNTYFVWLEQQVGAEKAVAMAQRLGIKFRATGDRRMAAQAAASWGAFTLGVADTTPLDLAEAYAAVAAGGRYCAPLPVQSIADSAGRPVTAGAPACRRAVSPDIAHAAADAARCPVGQQSAYHRCDGGTASMVSSIMGGRPVAGKTGSSERNATETFVGFTPQIAAAAIAADPSSPQDAVGTSVSAEVDAAVARTMAAALKGEPYADFPAPSRDIAFRGAPADSSTAP